MTDINNTVLIIVGWIAIICMIGVFLQLSFILFVLIKILRDVKKATSTVKNNIENSEKIINSFEDSISNFTSKQKLNAELLVAKGAYNIIKKLKKH